MAKFLRLAKALGAAEVRLSPGRMFLLVGLSPHSAAAIEEMAASHGLSADSNDPSAHITACAGAGACTSGHFDTKALSEAIVATAGECLDGSMKVHLSGCTKGCACQSRALTLVGTPDGFRLVLDGTASDEGDAQIAGGAIKSAIEKIARFISTERNAGESAASCLRRTGRTIVTKALRQE